MSGPAAVLVSLLRQVQLFSELSESELQQIASRAVRLRRSKGQIVFDEGDSADYLLVLTAGRAKVVLAGDVADEIILNFIEPFRVVGEIALLDRSTRSARLVAVEDCDFIKIPVTIFDAVRSDNAAFADKLAVHVTSTLRESTDQLRAICSYGSVGRIAWCLHRLVRQQGHVKGSSATLEPRPKRHELAQMTGCARETVSRTLQILAEKRCVTIGPGDRIEVHPAISRYSKRPWSGSGRTSA